MVRFDAAQADRTHPAAGTDNSARLERGPVSTEINPYAAPKAVVEDVSDVANPQAEAIRRAHINHETSIKGIGTLYYLSAFFMGLVALGTLLPLWTGHRDLGTVAIFAIFAGLAAGFFLIGRGLRQLRRGVQAPTIILAVLGLLGFPIGTLINGYILWLVLSKKGQFIFSPEYAAIVKATPNVKYRTSLLAWIALAAVVVLVLVFVWTFVLHR